MILKYLHDNDKFSFYFLDESENHFPVSDWQELQSEFLSQLAILNEFEDNGVAEKTGVTCEVDTITILKLGEIDKQVLELPKDYPYEIFIESDGVLTHNSFKFKYGFYDFAPNGTRLRVVRRGAIIKTEENEYLLSENQYLICQRVQQFVRQQQRKCNESQKAI
jgi:hypothetical protein